MTAGLSTLSARDRDAVANAVIAVEESAEPVPQSNFPALADPALRSLVSQSLAGAGRTLVQVGADAWISGYDDTIADRLAIDGTGVLSPVDAAVLALVLLHAVAMPASRGAVDSSDWFSIALPAAEVADLAANRDRRLNDSAIRAALRRLRDARVIPPGQRSKLVPGAQFRRLTEQRQRLIWENLIVAAAPGSNLARVIERRRSSEAV